MKTKKCCVCKQFKPTSEFYRRSESPKKLKYKCKSCTRLYQKERYYKKKAEDEKRRRLELLNNAKLKQCEKCGEVKSLHQFYQSAITDDGFFGECKACCKVKKHGEKIAYDHYNEYFSTRFIE